MTLRTLIVRSLRFHWRGHLGVFLGAGIGSAALIGALVVGDSVRISLRRMALQRLGNIHFAMETGDRLFQSRLATRTAAGLPKEPGQRHQTNALFPSLWWINASPTTQVTITQVTSNRFVTSTNRFQVPQGVGGPGGTNSVAAISPVLKLAATASTQQGEARANQVQLLGIDYSLAELGGAAVLSKLSSDEVVINRPLAEQLNATRGDTLILRARKPEALGADSPVAPTDSSAVVLRLKVREILTADQLGNLSLAANQVPPFNAFVRLDLLQQKAGASERANLLLASGPSDVSWKLPGASWRDAVPNWLRRLARIGGPSPIKTNALPTVEALARLDRALDEQLAPADLQLRVLPAGGRPEIELRTARVFLDQPLVEAIFAASTNKVGEKLFPSPSPYGVLTYLANLIRHGERTTPYSMITAATSPLVPADLQDDEILIHQWLAEDLNAGPGAEIALSYFHPDQSAQLVEVTNRFRVRAVLPMDHPALDRSLMPDFPGIAQAEKAGDWQTGFPLTHTIREKDDDYWKKYRGTPKAFITLAAGQRLWGNRFGNVTAVRFPLPPRTGDQFWYLHQSQIEQGLQALWRGTAGSAGQPRLLDRRALGFRWEPVRAQALAASAPTQDFGQLFLGFSFFLILAALILMALLFQFGLEQRTSEIGTLLALGFTPGRVRWLLLGEGTLVGFAGGVAGVLGGLGYAQGMIRGLTTIWQEAVGTSALSFHTTALSLGIGLCSSVVVCAGTIGIVLRKQARQPARALLAPGEAQAEQTAPAGRPSGGMARWVALGSGIAGLGLVATAFFQEQGGPLFFGAGSLLLVALLAAISVLLSALERSEFSRRLTLGAMGLRGCTRRRSRSLACVALLACGSFLIVAVGANRLDAGRNAGARSSGTGGFALVGESTLPVVRDLNSTAGREFYGLNEQDMKRVSVVPFRVKAGDDASCLNLNRAHTPRLLGVNPGLLAQQQAFTFARVAKGLDRALGWKLLERKATAGNVASNSDEIPAIGDAASIQWALRKKVGDTMDYTDERGRTFKLRLVAGVANSILQGNLIIDEAEFVKRFPGENGYRMFLIDVADGGPTVAEGNAAGVSAVLSRALRDVGLELTPTVRRLAAFNAVQNTYLNTFQVLGGLGLLLGSAGLGVVVLRNVLERRGEFGLLQAVGFRRRSLHWLVLAEHGGLLWLGLGAGMIAALAAILPVLLAPGAMLHYRAFLTTLVGVFLSGMIWTWAATGFALRGRLLDALKED